MPPRPKLSDQPETLRPFLFHGIDLNWGDKDEEAVGTCPWCGRDKFSVQIATGMWRCFVCNEGQENDKAVKGGNALVFIRMLWERGFANTPTLDYRTLSMDRKLLYPETLVEWQLAKSPTTGSWLLPGYNSDGKMMGLYQYVFNGKRWFWLPTPTMGHHLLGMNLLNRDHGLIYLCEGVWDGAALWETLSKTKVVQSESNGHAKYAQTASRASSLLAEESVLAIAGCQAFNEQWISLFRDKVVCLMCQNDHEKRMCKGCKKSYSRFTHQQCPQCGNTEVTDTIIPPASYTAMQRIAHLISPVTESIHFLHWGEDGYDQSLPSGYDTRDFITA